MRGGMTSAASVLMMLQVFLALAAFSEGGHQQKEESHHRSRKLETVLENHWIREQVVHRRAQGEGMIAKAYPGLSKPPPVFEIPAEVKQQEPEPAENEAEQQVEPAQPEAEQEVEPAQDVAEQEIEPVQDEVKQQVEPAHDQEEQHVDEPEQQPVTTENHVDEPVRLEGKWTPAEPKKKSSLALQPSPQEAAVDDGKKCWIFHHMNKSGGTTVKFLLKKWIHDEGYTVAQFDTEEWLKGSEYAREFMGEAFDFYWGSYTEGLRRHGGERCTWFTIFRHPASRLVSAYFYCQKPERFPDPLCANYVQRVDTMDLVTFAKHWTNFGLRQYVTSFILPEDITSSPLLADMGSNVPGWYKVRTVLDARAAASNIDDPLIDIAMYRFLQPAQNLLAKKYKAVGILEEFNTTLHLFNRALDLPNYDWLEQYARVGAVNVNNKDETVVYTEEDRVMDIAMTDVTIKRYLALDLLLYEHALAIHHAQAVQYGVIEE